MGEEGRGEEHGGAERAGASAQRRPRASDRERQEVHRPELGVEADAAPQVGAVVEAVEAVGGEQRRDHGGAEGGGLVHLEPARAEVEAEWEGEQQEQLERLEEGEEASLRREQAQRGRDEGRERQVGVEDRIAE